MKSPRKTLMAAALCCCAACILLLSIASAGPTPQAAQAPTGTDQPSAPGQSDAQARIIVNSNLVILPVTVKDSAGNLVPDLRRDEFRVLEDNVEQRIDVFTAEAFPLSVVILIDNDLKDKDAAAVEASLDAILLGLSEQDEAYICRFDQFFHPGKGFTTDQDKLRTELKRTKLDTQPSVGTPGGPFNGPVINNHSVVDQQAVNPSERLIKGQPTKALDDAVYASSQLLRDRSRGRRRLIVLISDGIDGGKKFNTFSYDQVVNTLLAENVTVYSVAVPSAFLERRVSPLDRTVSRLTRYPDATGGEVYHATKEHSLEEFYSRLAEEARYEYTLAYSPKGTDQSKDYHTVEVRVRREGLNVKTRQGYFTGTIPTGTPR
jgi:Ca-activated chloride channel family protein